MERLNSILRDYAAVGDHTQGKVLGAAFVVVNKDGVLYRGAGGRTGRAIDSPPFTPESFTWTASMTKVVTATCLMQLVQEGRAQLDDDLRAWVPELAQMQVLKGFDENEQPILEDTAKPITLRHLLTHTVGLGYDLADPDLMKWSRAVGRTTTNLSYTLDGWNTPLKFQPGEGWYYGSAIDWAGQVLERITGQSLGQYMAQRILGPLGMHDTTFHSTALAEWTRGRVVLCAHRDADTGDLSEAALPVPVEPPVESGGAGLWSTAADHAKVLQALLRAGAGQASVVTQETVDEMFRPQLTPNQHAMLQLITGAFHDAMASEFPAGTPLNHGIGGILNTEDVPGKRRRGSMMWLGMANSHWWIDREAGIAATLLVNVLPQPDAVVNKLYNDLEQAVYGDLLLSV